MKQSYTSRTIQLTKLFQSESDRIEICRQCVSAAKHDDRQTPHKLHILPFITRIWHMSLHSAVAFVLFAPFPPSDNVHSIRA